jgi:type II secretory pathway predicted ATPase ExeA
MFFDKVTNKMFCVFSGDCGTGKTTVLRELKDSLDDKEFEFLHVADSKLTAHCFSNMCLQQPGLEGAFCRGDCRRKLHQEIELIDEIRHLKLVIVVDEAHLLDKEMLTELRFLLNFKMDSENQLALILAGQLELDDNIDKQCNDAINQLVDFQCRLDALSFEDTRDYIWYQLGLVGARTCIFADEAVRRIFPFSCGSPRLINKAEIASCVNAKGVGAKMFRQKERNALWHGDTKYGPNIDNQRTYLISFMDEHSRYICHSEFYFAENAETVMDSLQKGIIVNGAPDLLYVDNGAPFNNASFDRACKMLMIKKNNHPPYHCSKNGKMEKFHQSVDIFREELDFVKATNLAELNYRWQAYLHVFYQTIVHEALPDGQTPQEAYERCPREQRFISAKVLENAFMMVEKRVVVKTGCVYFHAKKFTVDGLEMFIGKKVSILWKPNDMSTMWAEYENYPPIPISELVIPEHLPKRWRVPLRLAEEARMMNENSKPGSRLLDAADKFNKDLRARHGFACSRNKEGCVDDAPQCRSDEDTPSHEIGVTSPENAQA